MTAVAAGSPQAPAPKIKGLVLSGDPTVQLLPPAVRDRAKNREFRRLMVMLLILAVVAVAAGVAFGLFRTIQADDALNAANAETARILAEQNTYRADAAVADLVEATLQAQGLVTSTEVDWELLYSDIKDQFGSKIDFTQVEMTAPLPWAPAPTSLGLLRPAPMVTATFTVSSPTVLSLAELTEGFESIPGYLDAYFDSTSKVGQDGDYFSVVVISFDEQRFLGRFGLTAGGAAEGTAGTEPSEEVAP